MTIVASGTVGDRPFGRTVATVARRRFTGELRLDGAGAIGWRDGWVVAAAGSHPADSAVETARAAGLITAAQAAELVSQRSTAADEVAVVGRSARLSPEQIARLRRRVVANRAMRVFAPEAGQFVLDDAPTLAVAPDMVPIDPRVIVYQAVRAHYADARLHAELAALGDRFALRADADVAGFGFGDVERPVVEALSVGHTPATLVQATSGVEPRVALAALYALAVYGYVEPVVPARAAPSTSIASPDRAARPPRRAGRSTGLDADRIRAVVRDRLAVAARDADHFELLGVSPDATADHIRAAYFELARRLHPDRIIAAGLGDVRGDAQRLFAQINAAFGVLSHPAKRAEYEARRRGGLDAEDAAARLLEAEEQFRAGQLALRRSQLDAAIRAFARATELNPDEAEHHALLAWATWSASIDKASAARDAQTRLEQAIALSPRNPAPHLYLGKIARGEGDDEGAARHLRRALELAPRHGEAISELRIVEARLRARGTTDRRT
jgi:tetratricopeptide (TPR) repeat protein